MPDPLISCIVPVHDSERYLDAALASIRAQTWQCVEILVADDESGPRSLAETQAIASRHGARVVRQPRGGPASARNFGVRQSTGTFVAFLDADDLWRPEKLALQMACFDADPGLLLCTTHIQPFHQSPGGGAHEAEEDGEAIPGLLMTTLLARRTAFDVVGPLDGRLWFSDAADWFLRAADHGLRIENVPRPLTLHRIHGHNLSHERNEAARHEFLRVIKASLDRRRSARGGNDAGG